MSVGLLIAAAVTAPSSVMVYKCEVVDRGLVAHQYEIGIDANSQPVSLVSNGGDQITGTIPYISKYPTTRFLQFSKDGVDHRAEVTKVEVPNDIFSIKIKRSLGSFTAKGFLDLVGICANPVATELAAAPVTQKTKVFDVYQFMRYQNDRGIVAFDSDLTCRLIDSGGASRSVRFKVGFSSERPKSYARSKANLTLTDTVWFEHDTAPIPGDFGQYLHGNKKMNDPTGVHTLNASFISQYHDNAQFFGIEFEERGGKLYPSATVANRKIGATGFDSFAVGFCDPISGPVGDSAK